MRASCNLARAASSVSSRAKSSSTSMGSSLSPYSSADSSLVRAMRAAASLDEYPASQSIVVLMQSDSCISIGVEGSLSPPI